MKTFKFATRLILISTLFVGFVSCKNSNQNIEKSYVVMLSLDGFRWDYTDKVSTPNFDYIQKNGVKAKSLKPCFPTKTFPNHYSMATGLYPDNHGIVNNNFYDEKMDAFYKIGDRQAVENPDFYDGEPIWVTAEKQGIITASYFWVGSEAAISGIQPTYWKKYEHNFPFEQRIDSVIAWLKLPEEKRPQLITWYMHQPDSEGHSSGTDSYKTQRTIIYLDSLVGVFMGKINALPIKNQINLIFTSDHGMEDISTERVVNLSNFTDTSLIEIASGGSPVYNLKIKQGFVDTFISQLSEIEHILCWKTEDIPERFHYGKNYRTLDILVLADSSYSIVFNEGDLGNLKGNHGYDNNNLDMHAIFYAIGTDFKSDFIQPTFNNIDIYPLIAEILNIQPAKVDGKIENVIDLLVRKK